MKFQHAKSKIKTPRSKPQDPESKTLKIQNHQIQDSNIQNPNFKNPKPRVQKELQIPTSKIQGSNIQNLKIHKNLDSKTKNPKNKSKIIQNQKFQIQIETPKSEIIKIQLVLSKRF